MRMRIRMEELRMRMRMGFAFRKITFQQALQAVIPLIFMVLLKVKVCVLQHAERNSQSPKGPPISQEYARSSVPGCMDLPNPTPKAWQPGPSFVSSPSVRRKHRVRRVAHAADRRAVNSPARTSQQVES